MIDQEKMKDQVYGEIMDMLNGMQLGELKSILDEIKQKEEMPMEDEAVKKMPDDMPMGDGKMDMASMDDAGVGTEDGKQSEMSDEEIEEMLKNYK